VSADAASITRHFGHVIDVLRTMGAASVQCIATSPPYFGLRDYGLEPVIWEPVLYAPMAGLPPMPFPAHANPEAFATCAHDWDEWSEKHRVEDAVHGKTRTTDRFYGGDANRRFDGSHQEHAHGQTCRICGAWRGCLGLESDPNLYIGHLVQVFREAWRVLADDGVLWLNLGDSYARRGGTDKGVSPTASVRSTQNTLEQKGGRKQGVHSGLKAKDLIGIPWRAALALQADGWFLRSDVVWAKGVSFARTWHGNPMPESVTDRPTRAHEMVFLLSKRDRYFFDHVAVQEAAVHSATGKAASFRREAGNKRDQSIPGQKAGTHRPNRENTAYNGPMRNLRDVWTVTTKPYPGAHFAVWPADLVLPMVLAGTSAIGHCPACGKRWARVTEKTTRFAGNSAISGRDLSEIRDGGKHAGTVNGGNKNLKAGPQTLVTSHGFRSACSCNSAPVPDVVLDIFGGSGTTAAVALSAGRSAVLIDANVGYDGLQDGRIALAQAAQSSVGRPKFRANARPSVPALQRDLFLEVAA
jgi:DNA modification methylase